MRPVSIHTGAWRYLSEGLDDFVGKVTAELQRGSLFRMGCEGATLHDHLGLPRTANRINAV